MLYLAANNSKVHRLRERGFPLGWIMSPKGLRNPRALPFAIDNGLYHPPDDPPHGMKALPPFYRMLDRIQRERWRPMFVVVPDVPYHGKASWELSKRHVWHVASRGFPTALAVQDGMSYDVLDDGRFGWVFVGGSTEWKWRTMPRWVAEAHARGMKAHVARVNTWPRIQLCQDAGADSADGTGIFRGDRHQLTTVLNSLVQPHMFPTP